MRDNDGRKLDHKTLEALRIRAVDQVGEGAHPEDVAAALGLHRKTVYGWLAKYREGGKDALKAQPVPGRPPKLAGPQLSRLYALIAGRDPRQMQFEFALWTREMVREVIRREFGVGIDRGQRGPAVAQARDVAAAAAAPRLSAESRGSRAVEDTRSIPPSGRRRGGGRPIWFADEAGIRSDYHAGTTWSPVGADPAGEEHRGPVFGEHDLRGVRERRAAVRRL